MGEKRELRRKLHLTIIDSLLILQLRLIATKKKRMETCRLLLGLILWPEPQMIISMKSIFHTIFDTTILIMHQAPRTLPKRLSSKFSLSFVTSHSGKYMSNSIAQLPITLVNLFVINITAHLVSKIVPPLVTKQLITFPRKTMGKVKWIRA